MTVTDPPPVPDVHRTATLLRDLYRALRHAGFEEGQTLAILGGAVASVLPAPCAPTMRLNVDEIAARARRRA